ncbi:hypothetical protein ECDEC5C_2861 [Escherichia coli DEC5C]|nr:hypothetical protein ECDEC3D_3280 [Escherichia coli DEC3D]EHV10995.1 hypothetical protein ECDEC4E_3154 [Escherichia coli DEC4E]EHV23689.1 hypothetical protein ECDEC5A_2784 [Escherichia coli DEC5A]EHV38257.1 hypothetical protein ECDEC5C_2861 [Escherichia coli DEC5C]EHV38581.1 hypothetical protein ECDEC5D_3054 [Escherichia coli DEC5D]EHV47557.1 hypothetical protein ECDEC5E_2830 [Escherichia coli DEC5E]EKH91695.1 hypothetical protein EC5905_3598 [Escherichia coli 5905]
MHRNFGLSIAEDRHVKILSLVQLNDLLYSYYSAFLSWGHN